jgi:hypothetical protein
MQALSPMIIWPPWGFVVSAMVIPPRRISGLPDARGFKNVSTNLSRDFQFALFPANNAPFISFAMSWWQPD